MSIKVADYLFTRLRQLGIQTVFGVPGDYNLRLLDFVEPSGLQWVGTCNELNGAYAADGYARINGLSALITTFGVGELSAINGIAGAYAEKAPVIHIVGTPERALQDNRTLVHHTLADGGDYGRFGAMASHVTVARADLRDPSLVPDQIDSVLRQALVHSRPVYLQVPDDVVDALVDTSNLATPITIPQTPAPANQPTVLDRVTERMYAAKRPLILVDGDIRPMGIVKEVDELIRLTNWPTWTNPFGKGLVNESLDNVYGIYHASFGDAAWKDYFTSADLAIVLGPHYTTTNSLAFTTLPSQDVSILLSPSTVQIGKDTYRDISRDFLRQLISRLDAPQIPKTTGPPKLPITTIDSLPPSDPITQEHFWNVVNPLVQPNDLVLAETGTSAHGTRHFTLPPNTPYFTAVTWLSIGYMLPATLGATIAHKQLNKTSKPSRGILFVGDGSLQMSVQELSTMIREKLNLVIIVVNNDGYTIERAIHGRKQRYNDIAPWRHALAMSFFGAEEEHARENYLVARTWGELEKVLVDKRITEGDGIRVVEVYMEKEDVQGILLSLLNKQIAAEQ
ncbi:putative pyruvate decarboxylase [Aspergillus heteromorphus CBS 117.55]|uniref:Pyruvate decarboxylase n=1 Tax=Aspergillus heteromorphus CBS 117.55 TaxID=1448321 RepID=A0A317V512_9EURO|nr:putative pyruvate decarboxylase [Aspergillus heteromorphus CBS 117.55]PWY67922.1 putative pyruvate decarboxylase [Aspergillus heteromorphus CBS 117.55]